MNDKNKDVMKNQVLQSIINPKPSKSDPFGSYTGIPQDKNETPVQDADDL